MQKRFLVIFALTAAAVLGAALLLSRPDREPHVEAQPVPAGTAGERISYFALHGWEAEEIAQKNITIPLTFTGAYGEYADIQDRQGLPLRSFAGRDAVLYMYRITNYSPGSRRMLAELIVCDKTAAASLIYSEDCGSVRMPVS